MSKFRPWAFWRRVQYGAGFFGFWAMLGFVIYLSYFQIEPTCFDGQQNGFEQGVDCGGDCVLICPTAVEALRVAWVESFLITEGQYNVVAYLENPNRQAGTPELNYTLRLFNQGVVIAERTGRTPVPPDTVWPIFEGRISTTGGLAPDRTEIELGPVRTWLPTIGTRAQFRAVSHELLSVDTRPRLNVKVENTSFETVDRASMVAIIYDRSGRPLTASETLLENVAGRSERDLIFTWPNSIAKSVRSCEVPSDIMIILDRSGSMAADGGDPPEPLETTKSAARQFIDLLRPTDRVGVVSYATMPSQPIEQELTNDFARARLAVMNVQMGTEGIQYTNTGEAFKVATAELASSRKRENARKIIVFMTDGDVTRPVNPETGLADREYAVSYARLAAEAAKASNATIYTIGFGDFFAATSSAITRDIELIRDLASSPDLYFEAPTAAELARAYSEIATGICEEGATRFDVLPKVPANFAPWP